MSRINVTLLKEYKSDFDKEVDAFDTTSFSTFNSSYMFNCTDEYVIKMKDKLKTLYEAVQGAYTNIDSWWTDYNNDIETDELRTFLDAIKNNDMNYIQKYKKDKKRKTYLELGVRGI